MTSSTSTTAAFTRTRLLSEGSGEILRLLRDSDGLTVTGLAQALGVSRSTVIQRLGLLTEQGLVRRSDQAGGSRGRPAAVHRFEPSAAVVLATQIGLSGARVAVLDLNGAVRADALIPVEFAAGPERLLTDLRDAFDTALADSGDTGRPIAGIGIGMPGAAELRRYAAEVGASGAGWDRRSFTTGLSETYGAPVHADLDLNLLALAEHRSRERGAEVMVCVKLGTLIDAAIVINGTVLNGRDHLAGEIGHLKISGSSAPCSCGGVGCLDAVASGSALVRRLAAEGLPVKHVSEVIAMAVDGQQAAVRAVRDAGQAIGEALAAVVNLVNPSVVITWGYLADAEALLFAGIREGILRSALPEASDDLELVRASLGDLAGIRGAAQLVIDDVLRPTAVDHLVSMGSWTAQVGTDGRS